MGWDNVAEKLIDIVKSLFAKKKFSDALKNGIFIHGICEEMVKSDMSIDCFLLIMAYNGDGKHAFKRWSIIDGSHNVVTMPGFHYGNYVEILMDFDHLQLMQRICEVKIFGLASKDIEGDRLKLNFDFERIKYSRFYLIREAKSAMYYVVGGTTAYNEKLSSLDQIRRMDIAVNKIKNIVAKF